MTGTITMAITRYNAIVLISSTENTVIDYTSKTYAISAGTLLDINIPGIQGSVISNLEVDV